MRKIIIITFILYLILLFKLVIFKGQLFYQFVPSSEEYRMKTEKSLYTDYNLIPFKTIVRFLTFHPSTSTATKILNLLGNIALFVPFGYLLPIIYKQTVKLKQVFFSSICLSVFFELYQLITKTGQCDIDDVILNSLGGITGYALLLLMRRLLKSREQMQGSNVNDKPTVQFRNTGM